MQHVNTINKHDMFKQLEQTSQDIHEEQLEHLIQTGLIEQRGQL